MGFGLAAASAGLSLFDLAIETGERPLKDAKQQYTRVCSGLGSATYAIQVADSDARRKQHANGANATDGLVSEQTVIGFAPMCTHDQAEAVVDAEPLGRDACPLGQLAKLQLAVRSIGIGSTNKSRRRCIYAVPPEANVAFNCLLITRAARPEVSQTHYRASQPG